jgi:hypothetical protein
MSAISAMLHKVVLKDLRRNFPEIHENRKTFSFQPSGFLFFWILTILRGYDFKQNNRRTSYPLFLKP